MDFNKLNTSRLKRLLSILMLFIMLVVGVSPTVGMHFCGQNLHSVNVLSEVDMSSCCAHDQNVGENEYEKYQKDCCETTQMQIVTDFYQIHERTAIIESTFYYFNVNWLTPYITNSYVESDLFVVTQKYFPPQGYDVKDLDILSFICILRI